MSASLPSLINDVAAPARRAAAARGQRASANADDAFSAHLRDDSSRRTSQQRPDRMEARSASAPAQPVRDTRPDRPAHPADPRSDAKTSAARPQASDRARDRASDRAALNRADDPPQDATDAVEAAQEPAAEPVAIATASASEAAADAAVIVEVAIASDDEATSDAEETADKNDGALAAATGLVPSLVCAAPAPEPVAAKAVPASDPADVGQIGPSAGQAQQAKAGAALPGSDVETAPATDADSQPVLQNTQTPATPANPGEGQHIHNARDGGKDGGEVRAKPQPDLTAAVNGETQGNKPHAAHTAGIHLSLQPALTDATVAVSPAGPTQPQPRAAEPIPVQSVPIAIGLKALEGAREFEIRLDPAELGRVDVKLSISEDGRVQASLVVDRVETLALLQRDARTLERAFDQAGLTADSNAIQFSLRQDGGGQQSQRERFDDGGSASTGQPALTDTIPAQERPAQLYRGFVRETAVDIRV